MREDERLDNRTAESESEAQASPSCRHELVKDAAYFCETNTVPYRSTNSMPEKAWQDVHPHETVSIRPFQFFQSLVSIKWYSISRLLLSSFKSDILSHHQCLDNFFTQANAACRLCEHDETQSTLMYSDDVALVDTRTEPPVANRVLLDWPFLGYSSDQVIEFARRRLHQTYLSPTNIIILDERSNQDMTCLLLSQDVLSEDARYFVQTRADFESAVVTLKTIETGCGGAHCQLDTNYVGYDGVLRMTVRDHEQR